MSNRLQVVVGDRELKEYQRTADALGLSLSEWVRSSLQRHSAVDLPEI